MIREFKGPDRYLSNFYPAEVFMGKPQLLYPTAEHAYQAMKTSSYQQRLKIAALKTAAEAKRAGRDLKLVDDWDEIRLAIMFQIVFKKFKEHVDLGEKLLLTYPEELQEGNTWGDTFWGINLKTGKGQNWLGRILMLVRSQLVIERQP